VSVRRSVSLAGPSVACPKSPCVGPVPLVRTPRQRSAVLNVSASVSGLVASGRLAHTLRAPLGWVRCAASRTPRIGGPGKYPLAASSVARVPPVRRALCGLANASSGPPPTLKGPPTRDSGIQEPLGSGAGTVRRFRGRRGDTAQASPSETAPIRPPANRIMSAVPAGAAAGERTISSACWTTA
jgi:hypothetical protein